MNYKEKYNKLIEAIKVLKETNQSDDSIQNWIDDNVPELTEPADERIRKEIISLILKVMGREKDNLNDKNYDKMFDWLEKQSKENMVEAFRLEYEKGKADALQEQRKEWTPEDLLNRNEIMDILQEYNRDDLIDWLDKLSKQSCNVSPIDDFATEFEKQVSYLIASSINKENNYTVDYVKWTANSLLNYARKEIDKWYNSEVLKEFENQGEQKSIIDGILTATNYDKMFKNCNVHKFNIGDWIVQENIGTYKIVEVCGSWYEVIDIEGNHYSIGFDKEYMCHLWSIDDAKDGDVLVCPKYAGDIVPNIFIFKDIKTKDNDVICYCSFLETFRTEGYIANADPINTDFCPATKEQRDILFQKMKEEGYVWNMEKKELKKFNSYCQEYCKGYQETGKCYADGECEAKRKAEQNLVWREEDDSMIEDVRNSFEFHCDEMTEALQEQYNKFFDKVKSFKDSIQTKQEWSEEDEHRIKDIIYFLDTAKKHYASTIELDACIDWIKSIKQKIGWKPSDEQMDAVKSAALDVAKFSSRSEQLRLENEPYYKALVSLYNDLKKLKEE